MKSRNFWIRIFFVMLLVGVHIGMLHAQTTYTISGLVIDTGGRGIDGVTVSFSNGTTPSVAMTSEGGHYSYTVPSGWTGTVTPGSECYTFLPESVNVGPVSGDVAQNFTGTRQTYTISGMVTDGAPIYGNDGVDNPIVGAVITLSTGGMTVSDGDGMYTIVVPCGFSGTMSIMYLGYNFSPSYYDFVEYAVTSNQGEVDFIGTMDDSTYTISGTVLDERLQVGVDGVLITFFDGKTVHEETTSNGGSYSYTVPRDWAGTMSPSMAGYSFTPSAAVIGPVKENVVQDFTATAYSPTISGVVVDTSLNPIVGVSLNVSGMGAFSTGGDGTYSFPVQYGWSGDVTPTKPGWKFEPVKRTYDNVVSNLENQMFIGTIRTNRITISGRVKYGNGNGIPGVTVTFSGESTAATTDDDGFYSKNVTSNWTGTITPSYNGYVFDPVSRSYAGVKSDLGNQDFVYNTDTPTISLNPGRLKFAADTAGNKGDDQVLLVSNSGGGTLNWLLSTDVSWVSFSPSSGVNSGAVTVSVDPTGLAAGTYSGLITAVDANASNSPQLVRVKLTIKDAAESEPPFGDFATPKDGSTVRSSIPVSGWVLDDIGVKSVKLYRETGGKMILIGDAILVEGARPDVELYYPDYPDNNKAGWGYMLLTNALPNGDGTYVLHAVAEDVEGNVTPLGTKTITVDNANAVKPFGAIDTPEQGGTVSGAAYGNYGWVLTPQPNTIPVDGSTIEVYVDGMFLGNPVYNIYREDVASFFPGYANSNGAGGYFKLDTTAYASGVHTIQWIASDDAGNTDGIGSRFFSIVNTGGKRTGSVNSADRHFDFNEIEEMPRVEYEQVQVKKGFDKGKTLRPVPAPASTPPEIGLKTQGRLVMDISQEYEVLSGYMVVGKELRNLPVGSTLAAGKFYWHAAPGFSGLYKLVFVVRDQSGILKRKDIHVKID